jgi:hypothetical protein
MALTLEHSFLSLLCTTQARNAPFQTAEQKKSVRYYNTRMAGCQYKETEEEWDKEQEGASPESHAVASEAEVDGTCAVSGRVISRR